VSDPHEVATTKNGWKQIKHLLLFSANHPESLKKTVENHEMYLEQHPNRLKDLAYTLAQRREHLKIRSFCITDGSAPFKVSSQTKSQVSVRTAFVFTGQGAQWCSMGRDLMSDCPTFLASIREMDAALQNLAHAPSWSLEGMIAITYRRRMWH